MELQDRQTIGIRLLVHEQRQVAIMAILNAVRAFERKQIINEANCKSGGEKRHKQDLPSTPRGDVDVGLGGLCSLADGELQVSLFSDGHVTDFQFVRAFRGAMNGGGTLLNVF